MAIAVTIVATVIIVLVLFAWQVFSGKNDDADMETIAKKASSIIFYGLALILIIITIMYT